MVNMAQKIAGGAQTAAIALKNGAVAVATNPKVAKVAKIVLIATIVGAIAYGAVVLTKKAVTVIQAKLADRAEQKRRDDIVSKYGVAGKAYLKAEDTAVAAKEQAAKAADKATTFAQEHKSALTVAGCGAFVLGSLVAIDAFGINDTVADAATSGFNAASEYATSGFNAASEAAQNGFSAAKTYIVG